MTAPHWADDTLFVLDTETTSPTPTEARLVSIAGLFVPREGEPWGLRTIVNAGVDVPDGAAQIHGITTERTRAEGIPVADAIAQLIQLFELVAKAEAPVVIYNVPFDWTVCHCEATRSGLKLPTVPLVDPLLLDKHFDKYRKGSRRLADTAALYGVTVGTAHDAAADAIMTAGVLRAIIGRNPALRRLSLPELMANQQSWWRANKIDVNKYWERTGKPQRETGDWPLHPGA